MSARVMQFASAVFAMFALAAPLQAAEKHQLLGTWSVDVSLIQQPDPPKSVTITFADAGAGAIRTTVVIEAPDGTKVTAEGAGKPDGTAARAVGSQDVDVVALSAPSSRILVMGAGFQGHPASSRVFSLSDDGKQMIETIIRHLPDGTPYLRVNYWTRQ
jgi:hypothetical protein